MSKHTITRLWIAGLIVLLVGFVVAGINVGLMLAFGGHFTPGANGNGSDFVPSLDSVFWSTVTGIVIGGLIALAGVLMQIAAWIGALVNTNKLQDKTWFLVLLVGGILGLGHGILGFAVMLAYVVAGPDGTATQQPQSPIPPASMPNDIQPTPYTSLG